MDSASTSQCQNDTHAIVSEGDTSLVAAMTQPQYVGQGSDARTCTVPDTADSYLQANAWKFSGAAANAGVLIGLLLMRH